MKKTASVLLIFLVVAAGITWLLRNRENTRAAASYRFFYYPKLNVYFDPKRREYIYAVDEGTKRTWTRIKGSGARTPSALGGKVEVVAPGPEVWQHNEAHRQQYSSVVHAAALEPAYGYDGSIAGREKIIPVRTEGESTSRKAAAKKGRDEKNGTKAGKKEEKNDSKVKVWLKKGISKIFKKEA